jgi:hypothetical protein
MGVNLAIARDGALMRETQMVSLIAGSASPTRLLFSGLWKGLIQNWFLPALFGSGQDEVMAGGTPANPATLMRQKP